MTSTSPLRYPGGKTRFTNFIWQSIQNSGETLDVFVEPFCGGAGASISLLETGRVPSIALNDCDPLISSFWKVVLGKTRRTRHDINWLISRVETSEISIEEWKRIKASSPRNIREAAWKCLFLNRTSFNGILYKAGPIGGWGQVNRSLNVRFNREKLVKRLNELYALRGQVEIVGGAGWGEFSARFEQRPGAYLYLDPPYYHRAEQLYGYIFNKSDHIEMRTYLAQLTTPWMLSYDDAREVRTLYNNMEGIHGRVIDQTYSAHPVGGASFVGRELFYSNRPLPVREQNTPIQHVGLSVVGCVREIDAGDTGPIRIPTTNLAAVGA